jgi:Domain of unknown function (DUF1906)
VGETKVTNTEAAQAGDNNPAVAIIDTADNTIKFLGNLKDRKVEIVIRYLALKQSSPNSTKRIVDNGKAGTPESEAYQLLDQGFGLILVYEWGNNNPRKFLFGLDEKGNGLSGPPSTDHIKVAQNQADLDAAAAIQQTGDIGHPSAPVYFTVDFDLLPGPRAIKGMDDKPVLYTDNSPVSGDKTVAACRAYFERLSEKLGKARLGLYGGGYAHGAFADLVTYHWVAQSPGFTDTGSYLRSGQWHLFQQWFWGWFVTGPCSTGLDLDTDIQNPAVSDIGAFGKTGPYVVDPARTKAIFDARYVATRPVPLHTGMVSSLPILHKKYCQNGSVVLVHGIQLKNLSARILGDDGTWLTIDLDEDGQADGYAIKQGNFVTNILQTPDY